MAISNSLNSGVNGIKTFSKSLEVIGDNIANVNTTGFKGSRVTNKDSFSQTFREGNTVTNGMQVGSGTSVASISQKFTQGVLSTTAGPTDLGISGSAFFKVSDGTNIFYTRAGDFRLDTTGKLVTNGGLKVQNLAGTADVEIKADTGKTISSFTINKDGTIKIAHTDGTMSATTALHQIGLFSVPNPNGLKREGDNLLSSNDASGAPVVATAGANDIIQGTLELSNVDLTEQFSDLIVAQRAFQANSRIVTVSDSVLEEVVNLKR
jgi:flagellar hook protein FlgE